MTLHTNLRAINAQRQFGVNKNKLAKDLEKLSSGYKINRSADDAGGLAISEKMRAQIREMEKCEINVSQGINAAHIADGALSEISDMLVRARELCVMASNGIYGSEERSMIENEVNALFDEIERITASTNYNEIPLLRSDKVLSGPPVVDAIYTETVVPTVDLVEWGTLDFVKSPVQYFSDAKPAQKATVTLKLDSTIDFNDVTTLEGKSLSINVAGQGTYTYNFTQHSDRYFPDGNEIIFNKDETIEAVLGRLTQISTIEIESVSINKNTGELIFIAPLENYVYTVTTPRDGTVGYTIPKGQGVNTNVVSSKEGVNLDPISGDYPTSSNFTQDTTAKVTVNAAKVSSTDSFTLADINTLLKDTINVAGSSVGFTTNSGETNKVLIWTGMSGNDMKNSLKTALEANGFDASWDNSELTITKKGLSSSTWNQLSIEAAEYPPKTSTALNNISVNCIQESTKERGEIYEITLPPDDLKELITNNGDAPLSFAVNGYACTLYDSSNPPTGLEGSTLYSLSGSLIDVKGKSDDAIKQEIANQIKYSINNYGNTKPPAVVELDGNKVTVTYPAANVKNNLKISGTTVNLTYRRECQLFSGRTYFDREASIDIQLPMDQSGNLDKDALIGSGFSINGISFEFQNGAIGTNTSATTIDISSCATMADIISRMQSSMNSRYSSVYSSNVTASISGGNDGLITLGMKYKTSYLIDDFTDGVWAGDGLFDAQSKNFSGGTNTTKPNSVIDFSSITSANLDSLLGKGFRIACATCENEYVNVLFRYSDSQEPIPTHFDLPDGTIIYNYVVELDKVSDGREIVQDIVNQLQPNLEHFSWVRIGDPSTSLVVEDKRYGDLVDSSGNKVRGSIIPGLCTNFTYSVDIQYIYGDQPDDISIMYGDLPIYAGSNSTEDISPYIPLHIPNLSLWTLLLRPPQLSMQSTELASDWLGRIDDAAASITGVRAMFGADTNRLEVAGNAISDTKIDLTAAESRIRDADMAQEMTSFVKNNIITQSSQAMLAQANQGQQMVLQLLK